MTRFSVSVLGMLLAAGYAGADGGTVRLHERVGSLRITVFTAPTPLRAGPVDVSVFVQDAATGNWVGDAVATVVARPRGRIGESLRFPATMEAATNKLFLASKFQLPEAGLWELEVKVVARTGAATVGLTLDVAEPPGSWQRFWPWIAWPIVPVVLFALARSGRARERASVSSRKMNGPSHERKPSP